MPDSNGTHSAGPDGAAIPDAVVEDLLADDGCRRVLSCLADQDEPIALDDLARELAARESGVDPHDVDDETVSTQRNALFQRHLPRLTPTGVVTYNSLTATVALDTRDERILSRLS